VDTLITLHGVLITLAIFGIATAIIWILDWLGDIGFFLLMISLFIILVLFFSAVAKTQGFYG
jgi:hypothetical protein